MGFINRLKNVLSGSQRAAELPDFSHVSMEAAEIYKARQQQKEAQALYRQLEKAQAPPKQEQNRAKRDANIQRTQERIQAVQDNKNLWAEQERQNKQKKAEQLFNINIKRIQNKL